MNSLMPAPKEWKAARFIDSIEQDRPSLFLECFDHLTLQSRFWLVCSLHSNAKMIYEIKSTASSCVALSSSTNAVSISSVRRIKRLPSRCVNRAGPFLIPKPAKCFTLTDHDSLITYDSLRFGAVSSVVEHLVYTERVGGSKPSPPIVSADCRHRKPSRARD